MIDWEKFIRDGWVIVDIPRPLRCIVRDIADDLRGQLVGAQASCELRDLHKFCNDEETKEIHIRLSEYFWAKEYSMNIANVFYAPIGELIGWDVMVQYMPYLRIARPGKIQDNIGYHKDTQYGQTPYEVAVHIPFVDLDADSAIHVISGSHVMSEDRFKRVTGDGKPIGKGSIENRVGRPYLPKRLSVPEDMTVTPLIVKVGQAAIFSPAIFHGQEINKGEGTRVSCDLRFVSTHAPIEIRKGKVHAGYMEVWKSPVSLLAEKYYRANKKESE